MSNVLLTRLSTVFGHPESEDPAAYIAEMGKLIRGFTTMEQDKAADFLIRNHVPTNRKPWPAPNEIVNACVEAREMLNPPKEDDKKKIKDWTGDVLKRADNLIQSDLGRQAADEGWVHSLWDFCRVNGRLPNGYEIVTCQKHAKEFDQAYARCVHENLPHLKLLGDMMLARRYEKADHAHGVVSNRREIRKEMEAAGIRESAVPTAPVSRKDLAAGERD